MSLQVARPFPYVKLPPITRGFNFSVELLKHSVNANGFEAISFQWTYERMVHAQELKHRTSRNHSSSRAIPYETMQDWISNDPAMPLHLGLNKSGMQSSSEIVSDPDGLIRELKSLLITVQTACNNIVMKYNPHKEIINRYTEPWGWITGIFTCGRKQLMNFFSLRCTRHADPHIQRLAVNAARLYRNSVPQLLDPLQWHMPYIDGHIPFGTVNLDGTCSSHDLITDLIWSTARCAWVSYNNPTKDADFQKAKKRHYDCINLKHATPLEHQLQANEGSRGLGLVPGFSSYRMMIPEESATQFDFSILDNEYKDRDYII